MALRGDVASKTSFWGDKHNSLSRGIDFVKLNPYCHINYSIIFTQISFYPVTSSLIAS